jgi:hypothetical protein
VCDLLAVDVDDTGEMLAVETAGAPARDHIPSIDEPDLMRGRGAPGTFVRVW